LKQFEEERRNDAEKKIFGQQIGFISRLNVKIDWNEVY
jgi:hypothetical protein